MTISTIIPYRAGREFRPPEGPTMCSRCSVGLLNRTSDRVEETVDLQTNAELTVHIWEHDVDSEGRALCGACSESDNQAIAWLALVKWQSEDQANRALHLARDRLVVAVGNIQTSFACERGQLCTGAVMSFLAKMRFTVEFPPSFELLAGDMHESTMEMGANLRAWSDADEPQPARDFAWSDEECPKTERNDDR